MADENDPIVCERTVMLSHKLRDLLVLLRYPVRYECMTKLKLWPAGTTGC